MATVNPAHQTTVAKLYVALFNRAPDASGFAYWGQALANSVSIPVVTSALLSSPESLAIYTRAQTSAEFVATFYQTVFGRAPDASGLSFWTGELDAAGGVNVTAAKAQLVMKIVDVVSTPLPIKPADLSDAQYAETVNDREIFRKKVLAGIDFATLMNSDDMGMAKQVLANVTAPATPVFVDPTPSEQSPAPVAPRPDPNKVFVLTTGGDTLVGGPGNDTFNAPIFGSSNSINTHDNLEGGDGLDTLNASLVLPWREVPTLNNIEVVNVTTRSAGVTIDLRNATGVTHAGFTGGDAGSDGLIFNVGDAKLSVSNQNSNAAFSGSTATALSLSLKQVGAAGSLTTVDLAKYGAGIGTDGAGPGAKATTHNIDATNAYVALAESRASTAVTEVNVVAAGANALTLSVADAATVKTLTLTGNGAVDFSGRALSALETFTGGSGNVTLAIDGALSASARVNLGSGNDTITLAKGSVKGASIDGGDGDDTIITGSVTHAIAGKTVPVDVHVVAVGAATGVPDATVDTVSVTILGQRIVTDPVDITKPIAVASAIAAAVYAEGTLVSKGLKVVELLDVLMFRFTGEYVGTLYPLTTYDGNADDQHGSLALKISKSVGLMGMPAVPGSVDTLTGGAGADIFKFTTADVSSKAGAVTAIITDFVSGTDKIQVLNAGAASSANFVKAGAAVGSFTKVLMDADAALDGTVHYYAGQVGTNSYLVTDIDGLGYTNVIQLTGVSLAGINATDITAM